VCHCRFFFFYFPLRILPHTSSFTRGAHSFYSQKRPPLPTPHFYEYATAMMKDEGRRESPFLASCVFVIPTPPTHQTTLYHNLFTMSSLAYNCCRLPCRFLFGLVLSRYVCREIFSMALPLETAKHEDRRSFIGGIASATFLMGPANSLSPEEAASAHDSYASDYDVLDEGRAATVLGIDDARMIFRQARGRVLEIGAGTGM
jgi:hypothetical protein